MLAQTLSGASSTTGLERRQRSVSNLASIREMSRPVVSSDGGWPFQNSLLFARDWLSKRCFCLDTGAEICVLPATRTEKLFSSQGTKLTAAYGSHICTFGTCTISLQFSKRCFRWTFTIAAVSQPLQGADFIRAHSILVDVKCQYLIDPSNFTSITLHSITAAAPHLDSNSSVGDEFAKLLAEVPDVTTPSFANLTPKHGVSLHPH